MKDIHFETVKCKFCFEKVYCICSRKSKTIPDDGGNYHHLEFFFVLFVTKKNDLESNICCYINYFLAIQMIWYFIKATFTSDLISQWVSQQSVNDLSGDLTIDNLSNLLASDKCLNSNKNPIKTRIKYEIKNTHILLCEF